MGNHPLHKLLDPMNRRKLLGRGTALMGGALAGFALQPENASGQEKPKTGEAGSPPAAKSAKPVEAPNLHPPAVQVKGGKLRGFRDGKTYTFLGIPYAEADRFELPKPVQPWEGIKSAQAWGPVCPVPAMTTPGARRIRLSASLLAGERALPVSERLDAKHRPEGEEARHGLDARRRVHQWLLDGSLCL